MVRSLMILALVLLLGVGGASLLVAEEPVAPVVWQYRVSEHGGTLQNVTAEIAAIGAEGWELVTVNGTWHYFKRPATP